MVHGLDSVEKIDVGGEGLDGFPSFRIAVSYGDLEKAEC